MSPKKSHGRTYRPWQTREVSATSEKATTQGLHPYRFADNPEERAFAEAWTKQQDGRTLAWLLHVGDQLGARPVDPSDRDQVVAATVVQWLGSPVGQYFLEQLGYVKDRH